MTVRCAVCGRENDPSSKFCIDCGKPVAPSGAVSAALGETLRGVSHNEPAKGKFGVPPTRVSAPGGAPVAGGGGATGGAGGAAPPVPPAGTRPGRT